MRIELSLRVIFNLVVKVHHMQDIHKLSFILVETLYHYIKDRVYIHLNAVMLKDITSKPLLVMALNRHKLRLRLFILCIDCEFLNLR